MKLRNILLATIITFPFAAFAQKTDTIKTQTLKEVKVTGFKTVRGTGHMPEIKDGIIYAGKKNEVILVDSLDANKAIHKTNFRTDTRT
jgi:Fe(3+) dicitrate transport protein